jgi:broad specificity phosphatase PhoE
MADRTLILVKHASPEVNAAVPSDQWSLSEKGRASCAVLAARLRHSAPNKIIHSTEPKATETAQLLAEQLTVPAVKAADLHEHDRGNVPHMRSAEFISAVANFFKRSDELVLGKETATQATDRINDAVNDVLSQHADETLAVVTHGTVLALLAERRLKLNPFDLWRRMQLPSFVVVKIPKWELVEIVDRV